MIVNVAPLCRPLGLATPVIVKEPASGPVPPQPPLDPPLLDPEPPPLEPDPLLDPDEASPVPESLPPEDPEPEPELLLELLLELDADPPLLEPELLPPPDPEPLPEPERAPAPEEPPLTPESPPLPSFGLPPLPQPAELAARAVPHASAPTRAHVWNGVELCIGVVSEVHSWSHQHRGPPVSTSTVPALAPSVTDPVTALPYRSWNEPVGSVNVTAAEVGFATA